MNISERKFYLGCGVILAAALIIAGTIVWHDTNGRIAVNAPPFSDDQAVSLLPPGAPNPADAYSRHPMYRHISGSVTASDPESITLIPKTSSDPSLVQERGKVRMLVAPGTNIYTYGARKNDAEFKKEMDAFLAAIKFAPAEPHMFFDAPIQYKKVPLKFSDIKPGVFVIAEITEDSNVNHISAVSIFVNLTFGKSRHSPAQ